MKVKTLKELLATIDENKEVSVSENGRTKTALFGILEGTDKNTKDLVVLVGKIHLFDTVLKGGK